MYKANETYKKFDVTSRPATSNKIGLGSQLVKRHGGYDESVSRWQRTEWCTGLSPRCGHSSSLQKPFSRKLLEYHRRGAIVNHAICFSMDEILRATQLRANGNGKAGTMLGRVRVCGAPLTLKMISCLWCELFVNARSVRVIQVQERIPPRVLPPEVEELVCTKIIGGAVCGSGDPGDRTWPYSLAYELYCRLDKDPTQ